MLNLFAILISMAMILTGAPEGVLSEPVVKTLLIDNITVDLDGESLSLTPTARLAVRTDGTTAAYDFYIENGEEKRLPLQLTVDGDKLLLLADNIGTTLKLTREDLGGMAGEDGDTSLATTLETCREALKVFDNSVDLIAMQKRADEIYDSLVDRGTGTSEKMMFRGETLDVVTYEYDMDAAALGALTDKLYAENEAMTRYSQTYLDMMKKTEGFEDVDSFTAVYEKMNTKMHVVESISDDGRSIQDCVLTLNAPGVEKPMQFDLYTVKETNFRDSTISAELEIGSILLEVYGNSMIQDTDLQMSLTLTGNPLGEGSTAEPTEDETEIKDEETDFEGEGDREDLFYTTMDFSNESQQRTTFDFNVDLAGGSSFGFNYDNDAEAEGRLSSYTLTRGEKDRTLTVSFDVHESDELFEIRASEDGAVSAAEMDPAALLEGLNEDIISLKSDANVQKAFDWISEFSTIRPIDLTVPAAPTAGTEQTSAPVASSSQDYTKPEFTYLPEGYAVTDTIVDTGNGFVSLTVSNGQGGNIYISLGESQTISSGKTNHYYVITPEAETGYSPVTGLLVTGEDSGDYIIYNADDGNVSYSVFPDGADVPVEEILRIIGGIQF